MGIDGGPGGNLLRRNHLCTIHNANIVAKYANKDIFNQIANFLTARQIKTRVQRPMNLDAIFKAASRNFFRVRPAGLLCHNLHRDVRAQEPPAQRHRQGGHLHRGPGTKWQTTFNAFEAIKIFYLCCEIPYYSLVKQ